MLLSLAFKMKSLALQAKHDTNSSYGIFCVHLHSNTLSSIFSIYLQERERRSPPFNLQIHPFSDGVSALQIYCMKEGVKVGRLYKAVLLPAGVVGAAHIILY